MAFVVRRAFLNLNVSLTRFTLAQFVTYWPYYIVALLSLIATHMIQSWLPYYAKELAEWASGDMAQKMDLGHFVWAAIGIVVFRTLSRLLFFFPARQMERDLRVQLLELIENTPPLRYQNLSSGQIFQTLFADTEQIRALIGFAALQVGNVAIALSILLPRIIKLNGQLLWALVPMLLGFTLFTFMVGRTRHWLKKSQDQQGEIQNIIIESYNGKETIKNFQAEGSFLRLFKKASLLDLEWFWRAGVGTSFAVPLVPLGVGLSLIWGAHIIQTAQTGVGDLILFSGLTFLFLEPMMFVSWIGVVFVGALASWSRISTLVKHLNEMAPLESDLRELNLETKTAFPVMIPYWNSTLKINLKENEWSVVVGRTAHGKSLFLQKVAQVLKMKGLKVSLLAQAPYLYNDNLLANIFLGHTPSEEEKSQALEFCQLMGLDVLIGGGSLFEAQNAQLFWSLVVGENGKKLSGGQAKRVGLVRTLMSKADVLLWDDPFSAIDVVMEKEIVEKLKKGPWGQNKSLLLTSHRLSTVRFCDHILFIEKDQGLIEEGKPEDLLQPERKTYEHFKQQMV